MKDNKERPHTVIVCAPAAMAAAAVNTSRSVNVIAAAVGWMLPVTGVAGVPLMKPAGN